MCMTLIIFRAKYRILIYLGTGKTTVYNLLKFTYTY